jgi:hypothetical protein
MRKLEDEKRNDIVNYVKEIEDMISEVTFV